MWFVGFPELSRGNSHHPSNPYTESHLFCRHQPSGPQGGMEPRLQHVLLGHRAGKAAWRGHPKWITTLPLVKCV